MIPPYRLLISRAVILNGLLLLPVIAKSQPLALPASLSSALQGSAYIEHGGYRFAGFQVLNGSALAQQAVIRASSSQPGDGLSIDFANGGLIPPTSTGITELALRYSVSPIQSTSFRHVILSSTGASTGSGGMFVNTIVSDTTDPLGHEENQNLSTSCCVGFSDFNADAIWFGSNVRTIDVLTEIGVYKASAASSATLTGFTHQFLSATDELTSGDYNFDNAVDGQDYSIFRRTFGSQLFSQADGNRDGIVNAADYVTWRKNQSSNSSSGDFNGDGAINAADYVSWRKTDGNPNTLTAWRTNYGSSGSTGAAVPEPSTIAQFGVMLHLVSARRRSRCHANRPERSQRKDHPQPHRNQRRGD